MSSRTVVLLLFYRIQINMYWSMYWRILRRYAVRNTVFSPYFMDLFLCDIIAILWTNVGCTEGYIESFS